MFEVLAQQAQQTSANRVITLSSKSGGISDVESFNFTLDLEAIQPNERNGELTREKLIDMVQGSTTPSFIRTQVYAPRLGADSHVIGESKVAIRMDKNNMSEADLPCIGFAQLPMSEEAPHILPKPRNQTSVPTISQWADPDLGAYFNIDLWIPKKRLQSDVKSIQANFTLNDPVAWTRAPYGHEESPFMLTRLFKSESIVFKRK